MTKLPVPAPQPYANYFKNAVCFTCEGESGQPPSRTVDLCEQCYGDDGVARAVLGEQPSAPEAQQPATPRDVARKVAVKIVERYMCTPESSMYSGVVDRVEQFVFEALAERPTTPQPEALRKFFAYTRELEILAQRNVADEQQRARILAVAYGLTAIITVLAPTASGSGPIRSSRRCKYPRDLTP